MDCPASHLSGPSPGMTVFPLHSSLFPLAAFQMEYPKDSVTLSIQSLSVVRFLNTLAILPYDVIHSILKSINIYRNYWWGK